MKALGFGKVFMKMLFQGTKTKKAVLYNVLYVAKLTCNLFSVRTAVAKGNAVEFGPDFCCIRDASGRIREMGSFGDKLYQLGCEVVTASVASTANCNLWHLRLRHVDEQRLRKCIKKGSVNGISVE